jgi:hypothetical protein
MAFVIPLLIGGAWITAIICETIAKDRADANSQRYRIIIKRRGKDKDGREYENEEIYEFSSEKEMMEQALRCREISHATMTKKITSG